MRGNLAKKSTKTWRANSWQAKSVSTLHIIVICNKKTEHSYVLSSNCLLFNDSDTALFGSKISNLTHFLVLISVVLLVCITLVTICKHSQSTCVLKSDFSRWVFSTCPWMLDLHNRRPGRAANTSRSLCLQRPGRKHAPNLPLLHRPRKDNGNQHIIPQWIKHRKTLNSNKAGWPKNNQRLSQSESL